MPHVSVSIKWLQMHKLVLHLHPPPTYINSSLKSSFKASSQGAMAFTCTSTSNRDEACLFAMQLAYAPALSMALRAAIELDLLEIIAKAGPGACLSASDISSHLPTNNPEAPAMIDRILRLLACYSIVTSSPSAGESDSDTAERERLYGLAPICEFLVRNREGVSLAPLYLTIHDKVVMESMYHMKDAVLEGGVPLNKAYGMGLFAYAAKDPNFNKVFNKGMENHSTVTMEKILETYKGFEGLTELIDVGGGVGATISMIISKHPQIKGHNFDLPHVIASAPSYSGVEHVGGDMFVSVPNVEAIFMKWILHDWSDGHCLKLLKNCYNALPNSGKVIVVESILPPDHEADLATKCAYQLDMLTLACYQGGKERSEHQFEALAKAAGFVGIKVVCSAYGSWVIEFYKKD